MKKDYQRIILEKLNKEKGSLSYKKLMSKCKGKKFDYLAFADSLEKLLRSGRITEGKGGFSAAKSKKPIKGTVLRLNKTFGFVKDNKTGEEIFVAGKLLMGAMPGDVVMLRCFSGKGGKTEGEVVEISEKGFSRFTGNVVYEYGRLKVLPDSFSKFPIDFEGDADSSLKEGDKVLAEITYRGDKHSRHRCRVLTSFGSSLKASVCALSVLELHGVTPLFPDEVIAEARAVSQVSSISREIPNRTDLRELPIFTIDGADTKDIDDAISVKRTANGYELGVHIADVSHYVAAKSQLDNEAFRRGTSIYYANRVIPMLPKELSNGICSLNPNEDRLAFSCIMELDKSGVITDYRFEKTVIRSRVKGVYSEINAILEGSETAELRQKYSEVLDCLPVMAELADILYRNRIARGAPQLETPEGRIILDENDICVGVMQKIRGRSEEIIEDFMLCANSCAALFGSENGLPFVYRIHEDPPAEKMTALAEEFALMDIPFAPNGNVTPKLLSDVLESVRNTPLHSAVNGLILRSMSKAKYSPEPVGHFGLVLEDYAHFTSPIRRYPDLSIHRIMSEFLTNRSAAECQKKFQKFAYASSERSTSTEITAMQIERSCEDCYKAEFMSSHLGEEFDAAVISVTDFGMFAVLPNTCEGLIRIESLPDGEYICSGSSCLKNTLTGQSFRVGDPVRVKVAAADVSSGKVDFALAEFSE